MTLNFLNRVLFLITFWCFLIYSGGILILYFKKRNFLKKAILIGIAFFILLFLAIGIFQSISTYYGRKADPMGKYLIPPVNPNFYKDCFFYYFLNFFLSLFAAIFWGLIFFIFQKKNYVDFDETLLVVFGIILTGFPNFIIFLVFSFVIAIFFGLWQNYKRRVKGKISLVLPMIISLLITILIGNTISNFIGLSVWKL